MTKKHIHELLENNRQQLGEAFEYFTLQNIRITNDRIPTLYVWISNYINNQKLTTIDS